MTAAIRPNPVGAADPLFRLSVDQYHAMIRAGILTKHDSVELLEGWLIRKMAQNPPHSVVTELTAAKLRELGPSGWCVRSEKPITLSDSEPEPDAVLARGSTRSYAQRHPSAGEVALVVEVADATLAEDQGLKLRVYARAGIPVYWIVNVNQRRVEVHSEPTGSTDDPAYANHQNYDAGSEVPVIVDGRQIGTIRVAELLP